MEVRQSRGSDLGWARTSRLVLRDRERKENREKKERKDRRKKGILAAARFS